MGRFSGCLLACDIDGTTIVDGVLPQRNIEAIEYFKSEGGLVSLATGRTMAALSPILSLYNGYAPSIVCNGAMIYDTVSGEILHESTLTPQDLKLIDLAEAASPGVGIEVHSRGMIYTINRNVETDVHQQYEKMTSVKINGIADIGGAPVNKLLYLFRGEEEKQTVKRALCGYKGASFFDVIVTIYGKTRLYLEQERAGVSKGRTLLLLADKLGITHENVFAIGDGNNDVEMMSAAAVSACPAEAPDDVKAAAHMVLGSAKNGAVADFIEYLKRR